MILSTEAKVSRAALVHSPRAAVGLPPTLLVRHGGILWQLDLREGIDFSVWLLGTFEQWTVAAYSRVITPGAIVFDIGGNVGAHTLPMAARVGDWGRVYAFEPVRWAVEKLRGNLDLNPQLKARIEVYQLLLSVPDDASVPAALHASWPLGTAHDVLPTLRVRPLPTEGAKAATLDAFVAVAGISRIDFIKIDVDGGGCRVLRGARETLGRFRPVIVIELSPWVLGEAGETRDSLLDILAAAGYELADFLGESLPAECRALRRLIPAGRGVNALASPRA